MCFLNILKCESTCPGWLVLYIIFGNKNTMLFVSGQVVAVLVQSTRFMHHLLWPLCLCVCFWFVSCWVTNRNEWFPWCDYFVNFLLLSHLSLMTLFCSPSNSPLVQPEWAASPLHGVVSGWSAGAKAKCDRFKCHWGLYFLSWENNRERNVYHNIYSFEICMLGHVSWNALQRSQFQQKTEQIQVEKNIRQDGVPLIFGHPGWCQNV